MNALDAEARDARRDIGIGFGLALVLSLVLWAVTIAAGLRVAAWIEGAAPHVR